MMRVVSFVCLIGMVALTAQAHAEGLIKVESKTRHYRLTLQIGPIETMFNEAEAKAKHPAAGEVMVSGRMAGGMPGMDHAMGMTPIPGMRHVELHVYSRNTGKTVTDARVTIALTGPDKKRRELPIARMYGVREGLVDLHYGNNAPMSPGTYTVDATVNGEVARFSVAVPPGH